MVQFKNDEHEERYYAVLAKMKSTDCYHRAVAYLFTLDRDCARHIDDVFDFRGDAINTDGLHSGWQTGTSVQTTRLAFNLWNGFIEKGEEKRFTLPLAELTTLMSVLLVDKVDRAKPPRIVQAMNNK